MTQVGKDVHGRAVRPADQAPEAKLGHSSRTCTLTDHQKELDLLRDLLMDLGGRCDNCETCACSEARAYRYLRRIDHGNS